MMNGTITGNGNGLSGRHRLRGLVTRALVIHALVAGLLLASMVAQARGLVSLELAIRFWCLLALVLALWHLWRSLALPVNFHTDRHLGMAMGLTLLVPAGLWLHPAWVIGGIALHYLWAMRRLHHYYPLSDSRHWLVALPPTLLSFSIGLVLLHLIAG